MPLSADHAGLRRSRAPELALVPRGERSPVPQSSREAAVIDLGSNSWRLVVYRYVPGGWWRRSGQLQEPVRIAAGLAATGRLGEDAIARGLETLELFARYCRARGIAPDRIQAVATSAVRDAVNRDELLAPARAATGLGIRILTAEEEAEYAYLAAVNSTTLSDGTVLDLGGGSLQLVGVRERKVQALASWPLGAVRVSERLLPGCDPVSRKELKRARASLRRTLESAGWLGESGPRLVGVGGSVRNLATASQRRSGLDTAGLQGHVISAEELRELVVTLAKLPAFSRALPGIKPARADIILAAALVLETVLELGEFEGIEVTRAGLREGLFFRHRLLAGASPLVADVRQASLRQLASVHGASLAHTEHVARLALQLHESLVGSGVIAAGEDERELLHAAAILHDLGMAIGYDGHPGHSHYLILNAGLPGFGPRELALIAELVRCHRKGAPELERFGALALPADRELVERCALLLRLAELLETGQDQSVEEARLVANGRVLELRLRGEDRLARWSVERQLDEEAFQQVFGRGLAIGG